jgi:DNA-directed RNA polymerase II subunit RPB1
LIDLVTIFGTLGLHLTSKQQSLARLDFPQPRGRINRDESALVQSSPIFADASRLCASPYEPLCAGARWRPATACLPVQGAAPPAASESAATMSGVSFRYSEVGVRKVRRVQFGILGPVELKASSMCNIVTDRTFEKGKPIPGGLMDPALGEGFVVVMAASRGLSGEEENEAEEEYQSAHSSFLSS